jgi:hypothetical protein
MTITAFSVQNGLSIGSTTIFTGNGDIITNSNISSANIVGTVATVTSKATVGNLVTATGVYWSNGSAYSSGSVSFTGIASDVTPAANLTYNLGNTSGYWNNFYANTVTVNSGAQITSLGVGTASSGTSGEIRATNNITAYYSSDKRFKDNVQDIPSALAKVAAIGGKTFDWTDEYITKRGGADGYFIQKSDFGVIAQDVQAVFPLAVRTREDGTLAVDYEKLVALAFAAIVELRQEIAALKGV